MRNNKVLAQCYSLTFRQSGLCGLFRAGAGCDEIVEIFSNYLIDKRSISRKTIEEASEAFAAREQYGNGEIITLPHDEWYCLAWRLLRESHKDKMIITKNGTAVFGTNPDCSKLSKYLARLNPKKIEEGNILVMNKETSNLAIDLFKDFETNQI